MKLAWLILQLFCVALNTVFAAKLIRERAYG
jgi:hypothetical protein